MTTIVKVCAAEHPLRVVKYGNTVSTDHAGNIVATGWPTTETFHEANCERHYYVAASESITVPELPVGAPGLDANQLSVSATVSDASSQPE